jgi:hypothetical protein
MIDADHAPNQFLARQIAGQLTSGHIASHAIPKRVRRRRNPYHSVMSPSAIA